LTDWFPSEILKTIEVLKDIIQIHANKYAPFYLIILSDLLRDYSLQEPSDLRIRRRKSPLPEENIRIRYEKSLNKKIEALKFCFDIHGPIKSKVIAHNADVREWSNIQKHIKKDTFDFALTSPPYATALPYIDTQRLSLVWLNLLKSEDIRKTEENLIGSRETRKQELFNITNSMLKNNCSLPESAWKYCRMLNNNIAENDGFRRQAVPALLYRYFSDMMRTFQAVHTAMKPNGIYALIVGHNRTTLGGTQFQIETPRYLVDIAVDHGWFILESIPLETYKRYGIHASNAVLDETLLLLKK